MNILLILALAAAALVFLVLLLKKPWAEKVPPLASPEDEVPPLHESELQPVPDEVEDVSVESELEKPEAVVAVEAEPEPEEYSAPVPVAELEEPTVSERAKGAVPLEEPVVTLSLESYEERLLALKDKQLAALSEAIERNQEGRRERLQVELVALTESLTFLKQSYEHEISLRHGARQALDQMRVELDPVDYEQACESIRHADTRIAEKIFAEIAEKGCSASAAAAFQCGLLAKCRIDFTRAMKFLEQAVGLDGNNPDYLRSAAVLAQTLYQHKRALNWFSALEKVLAELGDDTVELALARRDLAYSVALVGRHKQAGGLYKQAMGSLTNLLGKEDPEMAVCWFQIGKLQEALGKYEKAEEPYRKALAILEKTEGVFIFGDILSKLAGLCMELEKEIEAIPLYSRLCALQEDSPHPDKAALAMTYGNLAEAYRICGKYSEAEEKYMRSLAITEELRGKDHAAVGSILQELVQLCRRQGKEDEAQAYQERAAAIFQRVLDEQEAAGQESSVKISL